MPKISIVQLETFVTVAVFGGFRRAAERLNTTQPNISTRIAALEDQLRQRLFIRDTGTVRLTPQGEALLPKARSVLAALDEFIAAIGDDGLFEGVLRLGVTEMVVHSWLGDFLAVLKKRFPGIDVDLTVDLSANLSVALQKRSLDLALQSGPFARQVSGVVPLGKFPYVWVGSAALDFGLNSVTVAELGQHAILTHTRGTLPFQQLSEHIERAGVGARIVPSANITACLHMTRQGLGVACLPEIMVRDDVTSGALVPIHYDWVPDALEFSARYLAEKAPTYVAEAAGLAADVAARHRD